MSQRIRTLQDVLNIGKSLIDEGVRRRLRMWDSCAGPIYVHLLPSGRAEEGPL
jgi:hypothetical protein